ncbi:MAG: hypothetical protein JWM93_1540 [Frankiales bacterium]|nr:hypothetical protein [Frankiales bacterium]
MTLARRWAPLAVFVALAGAWCAVNMWAMHAWMRNNETNNRAIEAAMRAKFPNRELTFPSVDYAPFIHYAWWPGVLMLVGVAAFAAALRTGRGRLAILGAVPVLLAGVTSVNPTMAYRVAGQSVLAYTGFGGPSHVMGVAPVTGPVWVFWAALALGVLTSLLPALLLPRSQQVRQPRLSARLSVTRGLAAGSATLVATLTIGTLLSMGTGGSTTIGEAAQLGAGVFLASLALSGTGDRRVVVPLSLVALVALTVGVPGGTAAGDVVRAVLLGALLFAAAAATLVPWRDVHGRLNAHAAAITARRLEAR